MGLKLKFEEALGYIENSSFLGFVINYDFLTGMFTLTDGEDKTILAHKNDVELMYELFELDEFAVFEKDVLSTENGQKYMIELHSDGLLQFHLLDGNFDIRDSGEKFELNETTLKHIESTMELEGNIYELIPSKPEFNIKIVKTFNERENHYEYYYACNNKEKEEIDLISVVFIGNQIIEEDYYRKTVSYEKYEEMESNELIDVSPQELLNYAKGKMYGLNDDTSNVSNVSNVEEDFEEEEELGEDVCEECECNLDECECDLW